MVKSAKKKLRPENSTKKMSDSKNAQKIKSAKKLHNKFRVPGKKVKIDKIC